MVSGYAVVSDSGSTTRASKTRATRAKKSDMKRYYSIESYYGDYIVKPLDTYSLAQAKIEFEAYSSGGLMMVFDAETWKKIQACK